MFVFGLACLALFSVISIVLGSEDPRHADPRLEIARWTLYGTH
jgi:hypothetical protein